MAYECITVRPLAGALGAEVGGVALARAHQDNRVWGEIHQAFLAHQVIVFREQELSLDDLLAVGRRFGEPTDYPFVKGIEGYPQIFEILKEPEERQNFGGNWHSDTTYLPKPPLATLLHALETPSAGGDTLFANQYLAYESLSAGMRRLLDGLTGIYSGSLKRYGGRARMHGNSDTMAHQNLTGADGYEAAHPAVRTHPETDRKALYVSRTHTLRFQDMSEAESQPLIEFLQRHATRPEFTCRVGWRPGTLTVWDNRCVQHFAINDYHGQRRRMRRLTVGPQVPA
ncbi:MAG: taurine dioxygenase [Alphaproteobacteria bacterium]|nr:taurine dioxygenase [Alphaproteobacteria bacterium]